MMTEHTQLLCKSGHPAALVRQQGRLKPGKRLRQDPLQGAAQPGGHSAPRQGLHMLTSGVLP